MLKTLLAATFAVIALAACGGGPKNLCIDKNVRCEAPLVCDPGDGVCKCGGRGGLVCGEGFLCDALANTCQPTRCAGVECSSGTSCDGNDGKCKCGGTGGVECEQGDVCEPITKECQPALSCNQIACPRNQTCNTLDGHCLCGAGACAAGKFCSISGADEKTCIESLCSGVTCAGASACDSADGYCKCNGVLCNSGEACSCPAGVDGGACDPSVRACRPSSACTGVACVNGTTCDPTDGRCKCGGPGGPLCSPVQICALGPPAQCQGGQQCVNSDGGVKVCAGGTSCDPEDGRCKCGGRGGTECAAASATDPAEVCVSNPLQKACHRPCDVRSPDCPAGTWCYFDATAATPTAYCTANSDTKGEGAACITATACFIANPPKPLNCTNLQIGQAGLCRAYCDVASGIAGCIQVPKAQDCMQILGAPAGYGYCQPK
ncbi:MAG: hypothetical protein ACYC8T_03435 [Myxococcaceae bacterium]